MKIRLHVNRREIAKGTRGWPWTLHTSTQCIKAKEVKINVNSETQYLPDRHTNPKVFLVCYGEIINYGRGRFEIVAGI